MREIKFRAWLQKDPYDESAHPSMEMTDALAFEEYMPVNDQLAGVEHLMQYTGLKDKNGVEIYEGDILKGTTYLYGYQLDNGKQFDFLGQVIWQAQPDVGLAWMLEDVDGSAWMLNQTVHRNNIDYSTGEVIGNIYENPELLEQEAAQAPLTTK